MKKSDYFGISVIFISYLPALLRFTYGYPFIWQPFVKTIVDVAYISFFWLILSGFREGIVSRLISHNLLGKFHNTLGVLAVLGVIIHPIAYILYYHDAAIILPIANPYGILVGLGPFAISIVAITVITSLTIRKTKYELWNKIHYLNYIFFILIYVHARVSLPITKFTGLYHTVLFSIALIATIIKLMYDFKLLSFRAKILENREVATDTFHLRISISPRVGFWWKPSQYVLFGTRRLTDNHPFSISRKISDSEFEFTYKVFGNFTKELSLKKEDSTLFVSGAYAGILSDVKKAKKKVVFLAGGVGITPFRAILWDRLPRDDDQHEYYLFYGAKDQAMMAYDSELRELESQHQNFKYFKVLEKLDRQEAGTYQGFITGKVLQENLGDLTNCTYFVSGPPIMLEIMNKMLLAEGVSGGDIINESFGY